jgi:hypothetical protein
MRDSEIRAAAKASFLAPLLRDPEVLVVEELGLRHGAGRVDIAVINGELHGYELKSDQDSLRRLPQQIAIYGSVLDRVSLIVTPFHVKAAQQLIPRWWEIILAEKTGANEIVFSKLRDGGKNPDVAALEILKLLWREEALELLRELQAERGMQSKPRKFLYSRIAEVMELSALQDRVRNQLKVRKDWRSGERLE